VIDVDWQDVATMTDDPHFTRAAHTITRAIEAGAAVLREHDRADTESDDYYRRTTRAVLAAALGVIFTDLDALADQDAAP
jgi:hypothetical protein